MIIFSAGVSSSQQAAPAASSAVESVVSDCWMLDIVGLDVAFLIGIVTGRKIGSWYMVQNLGSKW
jgi:hypothetical protein